MDSRGGDRVGEANVDIAAWLHGLGLQQYEQAFRQNAIDDAVLVYFGYPEAHEDDAERAVRAGLAVIETVGRLATREPLNVRVGIASGLVVVGDLTGAGSAQERGVVGETPNLAARLLALGQPDTLVIADSTRRQIGALFEVEDLGPQLLAGFAEPQRAWRVVGESGVVSRFEALRSAATPLVGRDEELDLLLRRWRQAKTGEGRVVLLSGEPGIGKSRLTAELLRRIESEPHTRLRYFCSPHHQDSALYPFIGQLERAASFARDDDPEQKLGKFRDVLAPAARGNHEIELLAELLSLPSAAVKLNLSPQRKREKLLEALLHQLKTLAFSRSVLMVFEDAHWLDPTSRELLDLTIDRAARIPVLLVITFRPEFEHGWGDEPHGGKRAAAAGDPAYPARLADRASRSARADRQGCCAGQCGDRPRIRLSSGRTNGAATRARAEIGARPPHRCRAAVLSRRAAIILLPLQTRSGTGRCLRHVAARQAPGIARPRRRSAGAALC